MNSIILDPGQSDSLIAKAIREGLIKEREEVPYGHWDLISWRKHYSSCRISQRILSALVLFKNVQIVSEDEFPDEYSIPDDGITHLKIPSIDGVPLIKNDWEKPLGQRVSYEMLLTMVRQKQTLPTFDGGEVWTELESFKNWCNYSEKSILNYIKKSSIFRSVRQAQNVTRKDIDRLFRVLDKYGRIYFKAPQSEEELTAIFRMTNVYFAASHMKTLSEVSDFWRAAALTSSASSYSKLNRRIVDLQYASEDYFYAYQIAIDTPFPIPAPRNLAQALKMRQDSRIEGLRSAVSEWVEILREGDVNSISRIKLDIEKACKFANKNDFVTKAAKISTILSLPVAAIEALIGIPPVLGITGGALGTGAYLKNRKDKDKYGWVFLGLD